MPLVKAWVYAAHEATKLHEPLADVIRDCVRHSRNDDPWVRGGRVDPGAAQDIALSLERARDVGQIPLTQTNVARIARFCCPYFEDC